MFLCCLLVLAPAKAQQAAQQASPHFYVPYGVRDVATPPIEESSSSETQFSEPYDITAPPQMQRRYPMHGRRFQRYGVPYGPPSPDCSVAGAIVGVAVVTILLVALATVHD